MAIPNNSILDSVKEYIPIELDATHFDSDLIIRINTAIPTLVQMGVVQDPNYVVRDSSELWTDIIPDDNVLLSLARTWLSETVKLDFDPPAQKSMIELLQEDIAQKEYRMQVQLDISNV